MVRHIVLRRLKSPEDADFASIRAALEAQVGRIPRPAQGRSRAERQYRQARGRFRAGLNPAHAETRAVVDPLVAEHWIADYEL